MKIQLEEEKILSIIETVYPEKLDILKDLILPSIRIRTVQAEETDFKNGESKIGGIPHLPEGFTWPYVDELPLAFIAQFNCTDFADTVTNLSLPESGFLYIFYDNFKTFIHGYDKNYIEPVRIYHIDYPALKLKKTKIPKELTDLMRDDGVGYYRPCKINLSIEHSLPFFSSLTAAGFLKSDEETDRYCEVIDAYKKELAKDKSDLQQNINTLIINKFFGYADSINEDYWAIDCLKNTGQYKYDNYYYKLSDSEKMEVQKKADEWMLFFQIDSDPRALMEWGDVGRIFFYIEKKALEKKDFSKIFAFYDGT